MSAQNTSGLRFVLAWVLLSCSTPGISQEQEPNNTCATAQNLGTLSIPTDWSGSLDTPPEQPDVDFYRIELTNHDEGMLAIDLKGEPSGSGTLWDPLIGVFDSDCRSLSVNDDQGGGLESRVLISVPADGTLIIAATSWADWDLTGNGNSSGSYRVELSEFAVAGSITGRIIDAENNQPLPGTTPPYAFVSLHLCEDPSFCDWVAGQSSDDDGRFTFFTDDYGNPLAAGTYVIQAWADSYQELDVGAIQVAESEAVDVGDIALTAIPAVLLHAAVLPSSRSVQAGTGRYVTAYASIINAGYETGRNCSIAPLTSVPADFFYGVVSAQPGIPLPANVTVDIHPYEAMNFVFGFLPNQPLQATEIELAFDCENSSSAPVISGLNTFLLSASADPGPDIVALSATIDNDGTVALSRYSGTGVFAVAALNLGTGADLRVTIDTGDHAVPVDLALCRTDPQSGVCLRPATPVSEPLAFSVAAMESATFGVFVTGREEIPPHALNNRIFVRFKDSQGQTLGSTSVAVLTDYIW